MKGRSTLASWRGAKAVPFRCRGPHPDQSAADSDPADAVRFHSPAGLVYPSSDVLDVRQPADALPEVTVGLMGLTGPSGVLPRYYSEVVTQTLRSRSTALRDFLDLLAHRFVAFFARGGIKYRPARAAETAAQHGVATPDPVTQVLLALTGYGTPHLTDRLAAGTEPLLHYAGLFAMRPRSADRLGGADVRLARHACRGGGVRRRLAAAAAGSAHPAVGARRMVPAGCRCRRRRAGLGSAGAHHPAHRPARSEGVPAAAAGSRGAASAGVAGARLCRIRVGVRHQSGIGGA